MRALITQLFEGRTGVPNGPAESPSAALRREGLLGKTGLSPRIHFGAAPGEPAPPIVILPLVSTDLRVVDSVCRSVYSVLEATKSFQIVVLTDMSLFKDIRRFGWPIEHIGSGGNSAGSSGSNEAFILAVRRTVGLYGASFVLECDGAGVVEESWKSLFESMGIAGEALFPLAKSKQPHMPSDVELRSWSGWRSQVNSEVETLTVGRRSDLALTLSLDLADRSSFGALVVTDGDAESTLKHVATRSWNVAVCESVPEKSQSELIQDYESALDGLALAGLGFACVVSGAGGGRFGLDFYLWTGTGLKFMSKSEVNSESMAREEISRAQKKLERVALAGLATSTFAPMQ